jgi:hypothetical protein
MPKTTPTKHLFLMVSLKDREPYYFVDKVIPKYFNICKGGLIGKHINSTYQDGRIIFRNLITEYKFTVQHPGTVKDDHDDFTELPGRPVFIPSRQGKKIYTKIIPIVVVLSGCTLRGLSCVELLKEHGQHGKLDLANELEPYLMRAA